VTHRSREKELLGGGGQTRRRGLLIGVQLGQLRSSMVSLAGRGCDQAPRKQPMGCGATRGQAGVEWWQERCR
jgi:hypothetical protein